VKFKFKIFFLILLSINLFAWDKEVEEVFKKYKVEGTIVIESLNTKKDLYLQ
jgi:intracellular septation protein A